MTAPKYPNIKVRLTGSDGTVYGTDCGGHYSDPPSDIPDLRKVDKTFPKIKTVPKGKILPYGCHQSCPKCGNNEISTRFKEAGECSYMDVEYNDHEIYDHERLRKQCKHCGYTWFERPADYEDKDTIPDVNTISSRTLGL